MIAVNQSATQADLRKCIELVAEENPVIISRRQGGNVVIITEAEFQALQKAKRNADYLAMLDESDRQLKEGRVIRKTMAELEAMAGE